MKLPIIPFVTLLLCSSTGFAQKIHEPAELYKILEASTLSYALEALEEPVEGKDHTFNLNTGDFYRKAGTGKSFSTMKIEMTEEAFKIKEGAEKHFRQKNYTEAREAYEKVLAIHPEYSKIITYIGQTYHSQGETKKAAEYFKKAIKNNYVDYMAHWFLGKYYLNNKQNSKALDELLTAHILNRNHKLITNDLQFVLEGLGYEYKNWTFVPQIKLSQPDSQHVKIGFEPTWTGYAIAKAVWAFEPNYKASMGVKEGEISILEEREALLGLYIGGFEDKKFSKTPLFLSLQNSIENEQFDEFILYEIFIVNQPFIAYQFPEELMAKIRKYILESRCITSKKKKKRKKK